MKIISWNVNGIRACLKKGFLDFVKKEDPDIICIQETKAHPDQVDLVLDNYKYHYWNSAEKKGYSGTAVFSKTEPYAIIYGMGIEEHDNEGRVIALEFDKYFLVNVYTPNSQRELTRLDYRTKWDDDFRKFIKNLEKKKLVIVCGDLNVAHKEIDLKNPQTNKTTSSRPGNAGFTDTERESMTNHLEAGFVDTFRHFYPDKEHEYTWWSYMFNARANNVGWRIDYFLVSKALTKKLKDAFILPNVMGSDHCPIGILLKQ
ncbi:exodeoxyribonuclease III [Candidatus Woesearchaeota archaeon]|nr:exodeoxyribonuclease III [Candidatus Woesearchaeota archaeon]